MKKVCVLLLSTHPLLSEGLRNLLGEKDDLVLIGPRALEDRAITEVAESAPDVVLVAGQDDDDTTANAFMLQILQHYPDLPVIQINLSAGNIVRVFTSHTLPARSADLLDVIRSFPARTQTRGS
jgi:DNA-binding NarL/FixJ family response regulator